MPLHAAQGDDDIMSKPPTEMPRAAEQGRCARLIGMAMTTWGKLTEAELLQLDGHALKLAGLIEHRYVISREEARDQVRIFLATHKR